MPFTIDGHNVVYDHQRFRELAQAAGAKFGNRFFTSRLEELDVLLRRVDPPLQRQEVTYAIRNLDPGAKVKYKKALKYVIFHWPDILFPGTVDPLVPNGGRIPNKKTFLEYYPTMDQNTDFVDLMYGVAAARALLPYNLNNGRVRQADDFNNASNLGTGLAFGRTWQGTGILDTTAQTTRDDVVRGVPQNQLQGFGGMQAQTRNVYARGLLSGRYSPTGVYGLSNEKIRKDAHLNMSTFMQNNQNRRKQAERHYWAHARFVKAVRRACKGGIAMVASAPEYRQVEAKVHFALDRLGDLGKMARKDKLPNKDEYVAITTSELCFCCRYWEDREFPLSNVVKFYVNGNRVYAPWERNWEENDAEGNPVFSNMEAWRRYMLSRDCVGEGRKAFPKWPQPDEDD